MGEFFRDFMKKARALYDKAFPAAKRMWGSYGYYISLALLVMLFGVAAYLYKNGDPPIEPAPVAAIETPNAVSVMAEASLAPTATPVPEPVFIKPVVGEITRVYAPETLTWNETLGQWRTHPGIDFAAVSGAAVMASESGVVLNAYEDRVYGYVIELGHAKGYVTRYCSLGTLELVKIGDTVEKGQVISSVGTTALIESADGAHLHFEMEYDGARIEPVFE
ncbi:MAG: peptidoglycan DD-metalloendopeptidase family protein [Christensenellales bacterium]|jgi:murein DD-endopeptidase MepM/ murein hydrolase activator NlpD